MIIYINATSWANLEAPNASYNLQYNLLKCDGSNPIKSNKSKTFSLDAFTFQFNVPFTNNKLKLKWWMNGSTIWVSKPKSTSIMNQPHFVSTSNSSLTVSVITLINWFKFNAQLMNKIWCIKIWKLLCHCRHFKQYLICIYYWLYLYGK